MLFRPMRGVVAVVAASLALAVLTPLPAMADGPLNVKLRLGSRCLSGHKPADVPVTVRLLRSDGTLLESRRDDTTELDWSVCFTRHRPVTGNRIRLVHLTLDRTVRVPDLTVSLDRVTNVVRGHAPAGKAITLVYGACTAAGDCTESAPITATADRLGGYRKDLSSSSIDIDGSDLVRASYTNSQGDLFEREGRAPYMTISRPNRMSLSCLPAGTTTVRLLSGTGVLRAVKAFRTQGGCGRASGTFRKNGRAVNIHAGDRIKSDFASDARMAWPSPFVAASGYEYSLRCFANARWYLTIVVDGSDHRAYSGVADASGRSSDLGYQFIPPGAALRVACESIRGDRVTASGTAS